MALAVQVDLDCKLLAVTGRQNEALPCTPARCPTRCPRPRPRIRGQPVLSIVAGVRGEGGGQGSGAYRGPFSLPYTRTFPAVTLSPVKGKPWKGRA